MHAGWGTWLPGLCFIWRRTKCAQGWHAQGARYAQGAHKVVHKVHATQPCAAVKYTCHQAGIAHKVAQGLPRVSGNLILANGHIANAVSHTENQAVSTYVEIMQTKTM